MRFREPSRSNEWPSLGVICLAEDSMELRENKLLAFLRGERVDRARRGIFCDVELFIRKQRPSEVVQTKRLPNCVT